MVALKASSFTYILILSVQMSHTKLFWFFTDFIKYVSYLIINLSASHLNMYTIDCMTWNISGILLLTYYYRKEQAEQPNITFLCLKKEHALEQYEGEYMMPKSCQVELFLHITAVFWHGEISREFPAAKSHSWYYGVNCELFEWVREMC